MSPTTLHNTLLFTSIVLVSLASAGSVYAVTETVTLENGKTYEVETDKRGEPVRAKNRQVEIKNLGIDVRKSASFDSPVYVWMWNARIKRKGTYKVTVTTPIDETVSTSFEVVGNGEAEQELFDSEAYPALWAWLDGPEASWIPFIFSFEDTKSGKTFELVQWQFFDDPFKRAIVRAAYAATVLADTASAQSASSNETALVYFFRDHGRPKKDFDLFIDALPIASLPPRSFTSVEAPSGWHIISGAVSPEWFEFRPGREYLFRIIDAGGYYALLLDDLPDIGLAASGLGLAHVDPTQSSSNEFQQVLDSYTETRRDTSPGYGPRLSYSKLTYKEKEPGLLSDYGPARLLAGKTRFTVTDSEISYQSKKHNLIIPMSDISSIGIYTVLAAENWVEISYSEQGILRKAFFGGAYFTLDMYNRTKLAYLNARSKRTNEEGILLPFLESDWELGYNSEDDTQYIYEYVRPGQSVDNWTELVTVQNFNKRFLQLSVDEQFNNYRNVSGEQCPGSTVQVIQQMPEGIIYEAKYVNCEQGADEHLLARVLDGIYNRFTVTFTVRGETLMTPERRAEWLEELMNLSIYQY